MCTPEKDDSQNKSEKIAVRAHLSMISAPPSSSQVLYSCGNCKNKSQITREILCYLLRFGSQDDLRDKIMSAIDVLGAVTPFRLSFLIITILDSFGDCVSGDIQSLPCYSKSINLEYNSSGKIVAASIRTFQLDTKRIVERDTGERSFHIFYQFLSGASPMLRLNTTSYFLLIPFRSSLTLTKSRSYDYLKHGDCFSRKEMRDESFDFQKLQVLLWL